MINKEKPESRRRRRDRQIKWGTASTSREDDPTIVPATRGFLCFGCRGAEIIFVQGPALVPAFGCGILIFYPEANEYKRQENACLAGVGTAGVAPAWGWL